MLAVIVKKITAREEAILKITARRLVDSEVMKTILGFMYPRKLCLIQGVNKKFYHDHVPFSLYQVSMDRTYIGLTYP